MEPGGACWTCESQGRIAADVIAGRDSRYRGTQGTAIIGLFGGAVAWTGLSEKTLKKIGDPDFEKIYLFPNAHAGYYPGAKMIGIKVIFRRSDGRVLGAQALGEDGPAVDKRISALAMAIQMGRRSTTWRKPSYVTRPSSEARKTQSTSRGWSPRMCFGVTCRSVTGIPSMVLSFLTSASQWNWRWSRAGCGEHTNGAAPVSARRTAPRSRDPYHLPLGTACLLRDAHPFAERVQSPEHLRRDALAGDVRSCF